MSHVAGAYTGILRDDLQAILDIQAQRYPGVDVSTDFYRANMSRLQAMSNGAALTTQVMTSVPMWLREGEVVTSATFVSATTAANTPTNHWVALYGPHATPASAVLLGQTPDLEDAAWGANAAKTFTFDAPITVETTGWHRVALMVKATATPTLAGVTLHNAVESAAIIIGELALSATSGSSLTDTAPGTIGALTAIAAVPLCILT